MGPGKIGGRLNQASGWREETAKGNLTPDKMADNLEVVRQKNRNASLRL